MWQRQQAPRALLLLTERRRRRLVAAGPCAASQLRARSLQLAGTSQGCLRQALRIAQLALPLERRAELEGQRTLLKQRRVCHTRRAGCAFDVGESSERARNMYVHWSPHRNLNLQRVAQLKPCLWPVVLICRQRCQCLSHRSDVERVRGCLLRIGRTTGKLQRQLQRRASLSKVTRARVHPAELLQRGAARRAAGLHATAFLELQRALE
mmetsp:Transcript_15543/g.64490  ORF Transcript_15543/g.64490 Transcript_15543/m.64490 type:complete len:209 (+) Transcript_15543:129-755(+)